MTELTVDQIAAERGITKRWAYEVLRQQHEAEALPVPANQREAILTLLFRDDTIKTSYDLTQALHHNGHSLSAHDTTKTLWSLQKTGHVKFRERQKPRFLYAIKLTDLGRNEARDLMLRDATEQQEAATEAVLDELVDEGLVEEVIQVDAEIAEEEEVPVLNTDDYVLMSQPITANHPAIADVRDRARKAKRLATAAQILEEVGEDEMALTLMGKTEFTPLELEVIDILEHMQEI